MAYTTTSVLQYCDSLTQLLADFSSVFVTQTSTGNPSTATMIAGVTGTGTTNTYGRILNSSDSQTELALLQATYAMGVNISAYLTGLQNPNGLYQQCFVAFDKLDAMVGGLNTFLSANEVQVHGYFAQAFNLWCSVATQVTPGRTSANAPVALASSNYFPTADVDSLWTFTTGTGTAMGASAVGTNPSTSVAGGGCGLLVIYKANGTDAAGGAMFTITYRSQTGNTMTTTYTTSAGVPAASGSLSTGYLLGGALGSQIISVTGSGMTAGEQYVIGVRQSRTLAGY